MAENTVQLNIVKSASLAVIRLSAHYPFIYLELSWFTRTNTFIVTTGLAVIKLLEGQKLVLGVKWVRHVRGVLTSLSWVDSWICNGKKKKKEKKFHKFSETTEKAIHDEPFLPVMESLPIRRRVGAERLDSINKTTTITGVLLEHHYIMQPSVQNKEMHSTNLSIYFVCS